MDCAETQQIDFLKVTGWWKGWDMPKDQAGVAAYKEQARAMASTRVYSPVLTWTVLAVLP